MTLLGDSILCRGYENGEPVAYKDIIKPTLYGPSPKGKWKTLDGQPMAPIKQDGAKRARDFIQQYKDVEGSIHKIAAKIMGAESYNGWTYWHYNLNGSNVLIDNLRKKFIVEKQI